MPHLFRPYADSIARTVLLAILIVPFLAIGLGYWVTASEYVTDRTVTLDQPVPFSHEHHAGGLGRQQISWNFGATHVAIVRG